MNIKLTAKEYKSNVKPIWCPRCGDYGFFSALLKSFEAIQLNPHETVTVSGIGCAGRIPAFLKTFGFHGAHGRLLPTALGIKMANPRLKVIGIGGDGDGFAIGMGHFPHAIRRNVDMLYVVLDNSLYGLTKGQSSPTTQEHHITKTNPYDIDGQPLDPVALALAAGAGFVARIFTGNMKQMLSILPEALRYKGFAFVHALSPCSTFYDTFGLYLKNVKPLSDDYVPTDRIKALEIGSSQQPIYSGIIYKSERETLDQRYQKMISENLQPEMTIRELALDWSK